MVVYILGISQVHECLKYNQYRKNERNQYKGWPKYIVKNELTNKKQLVSKDENFFLTSLNGLKEKYTIKAYDTGDQSIKVFSEELKVEGSSVALRSIFRLVGSDGSAKYTSPEFKSL